MRRILFLIASVLVSGFFLWLALRDIELGAVAQAIAQTNLGWYIVGLLLIVLGLWTRAIRWRGLLGNKIPLSHAFHILNIGMMLNLLPLRIGEVARSLLATRDGVPFVTGATSIVVERVVDVLLVVITLTLCLTRVPTVPQAITNSALLFGAASVVAFIVLIILARYPKFAHRLIDEVEKRLSIVKRLSLGHLFGQVIDGLEPLTHPRRFAHTIFWTLVSWFISFVTYYVLEIALGVQEGDLVLGALLSMTLASLGIAVPLSLAGIGPFQAAIRAAGEMAGFTAVQGASLGLLTHSAAVLVYCVLGTIGLLVMGVSVSSIMGEREKINTPEPT